MSLRYLPPYRRASSRPEYPEYLESVTAQAAEARSKDRRPSPGQEDRPLDGLGACLALSIAVLIRLAHGCYELDHPPSGWCQDNPAACVHF